MTIKVTDYDFSGDEDEQADLIEEMVQANQQAHTEDDDAALREAIKKFAAWAVEYDHVSWDEAKTTVDNLTQKGKTYAEDRLNEVQPTPDVGGMEMGTILKERPPTAHGNTIYKISMTFNGKPADFVIKDNDLRSSQEFKIQLLNETDEMPDIDDWSATQEALWREAEIIERQADPVQREYNIAGKILVSIHSSGATDQIQEMWSNANKVYVDGDAGEILMSREAVEHVFSGVKGQVDRELVRDILRDDLGSLEGISDEGAWRFSIDGLRDNRRVSVDNLLESAGVSLDDDTDDDPDADGSDGESGDDDPDIVTDGGVEMKPGHTLDADIYRTYQGCPGTGKTHTLMGVLDDEITNGTHPEDIAASTFRRSMAGEFKERARSVVGELPDEHWFGTTHSLCYRLLRLDHGDVVQDDDRREVCEQLNVGFTGSNATLDGTPDFSGSKVGDMAFAARSYALNTEIDPVDDWRESAPMDERSEIHSKVGFERFNRAYESYKDEHGLVDFDDMLRLVRDQGLVPPVEVLIEDEFQDKTPLQVSVFETWADEIDRVYVAGDRFQAINEWAGSDPQHMVDAMDAADEGIVLDTSYRFGPSLWRWATDILDRVGYDVPEIEPDDECRSSVERISYDEYRRMVAQDSDVESMHLFQCNYMLDNATDVLEAQGIPFSSPARGGTWTASRIDQYNGLVKLDTAPRAGGESYGDLSGQISLDGISAREALGAARALRSPAMYRGRQKSNTVSLLERIIDEDAEDAKRSDIDLLKRFSLGDIADVIASNGDIFDWDALVKSGLSGESVLSMYKTAFERNGGTIDGVNHTVQTIHSAKGDEDDRVYLFDGISRKTVSESSPVPWAEEELARVFFVGATRAREDLYVVSSPGTDRISLPEVGQ